MVWTFVGLLASAACRGVRRGLRHRARAVRGVGRGCFRVELGELVAIHRPQIRVRSSQGLVDTMRAGLQGGGKEVRLVCGPALPVVGGMCP